jgi:uncharacterized membrane protein HdeD (DUF308 family)
MESDDYEAPLPPGMLMAQSWQATLILGAVTLILGIIVTFRPSGSLTVIAALFGILMIISGIFHLVRIFGHGAVHRVWRGVAGVLLIVIGLVLIRHLHLTVALIGLYVGITWVVQGLAALIGGIGAGGGEGRGWWIAYGVVSLIAGIVVTVTPVTSITVLAVLLGVWFIIMGIMEIIGGLMLRRAVRATRAAPAASAGSAVGAS